MTKAAHQTGRDEAVGWFAGRLPSEWFTGAPQVRMDREEILVVGTLSEPQLPEGSGEDAAAAASAARIDGFREDTRERRMVIAQEAQHRSAGGSRGGGAAATLSACSRR